MGFTNAIYAQMQSDNYNIPASVLSGGGAPMTSASYQTNSTLGQPSPVTESNSANYGLDPGFWYTVEMEAVDICECDLIPDSTTVPRGGTLGLWATATNNTDQVQSVRFATKVRLPNGKMYPPSGFLFGPVSFSLGAYGTKSGHLNQSIPGSAPLGTYTYYGYVAQGVVIISQCEFAFQVTQTTAPAEGTEDWTTELDVDFTE